MPKTRTVRESNWILNSCNRLWEHSIDTLKANPPLFRRVQRREISRHWIEWKVEKSVGKFSLPHSSLLLSAFLRDSFFILGFSIAALIDFSAHECRLDRLFWQAIVRSFDLATKSFSIKSKGLRRGPAPDSRNHQGCEPQSYRLISYLTTSFLVRPNSLYLRWYESRFVFFNTAQ